MIGRRAARDRVREHSIFLVCNYDMEWDRLRPRNSVVSSQVHRHKLRIRAATGSARRKWQSHKLGLPAALLELALDFQLCAMIAMNEMAWTVWTQDYAARNLHGSV